MFNVSSFYLEENKGAAYQERLQSDEAKQLFADIDQETGWRYVETFWPILGIGEYDCKVWWEIQNWACFDAIRGSEALDRFFTRTFELRSRYSAFQPQTSRPVGGLWYFATHGIMVLTSHSGCPAAANTHP